MQFFFLISLKAQYTFTEQTNFFFPTVSQQVTEDIFYRQNSCIELKDFGFLQSISKWQLPHATLVLADM